MNIVFLKLYITDEVNSAFYNSQEMGLAKALVTAYPHHRVDIVMLSRVVSKREDIDVADKRVADCQGDAAGSRIRIHTLPGKGVGHHGIIDLGILKELKADLVHLLADNMIYAPQVIDYCLKNGIKCHLYIGTLYTDSTNGMKQLFSRALISRNIAAYKKVPVYAKTPFVQKQLKEFGVEAKLAPVGLDKNGLEVSEKDIYEIREHYGLPFNKKILLFVGRLEEYKRPLEAVELLKKLTKTDGGADYNLLVIGDGVLAEELSGRIKESRLEGRVRHIKKVPNSEMKDIYKAVDYFVNFNRVEIYGMAILEAMANMCPVIAMKAPGPEFILDDGRTGYLCSSLDIMKERVTLLSGDEELRRSITKNAREKVEKELTWDRTVELFDGWGTDAC